MSQRASMGSDSLWEMVLVPVLITGIVAVGRVWSAGLIVAAFVGASLPGTVGEGMAAVVSAFPRVGEAWSPAIPSGLVWLAAVILLGGLGPMAWRLWRLGSVGDRGAAWADTAALRRAGLLLTDRPLPNADMEKPDAG